MLAVLFAAAMVVTLVMGRVDPTVKGNVPRESLPKAFGVWTSQDIETPEGIAEVLYTADLLERRFVNIETGRTVGFFMSAARDGTSFHDPHLCLSGVGSLITRDEPIDIEFDGKTVGASLLEQSNPYGKSIVIHWYVCGDRTFPDTTSVEREVRVAKLRDFRHLLAHLDESKSIQRDLNARQYYWYRFSTEEWEEDSDADTEELTQFIREFALNAKMDNE